MKISKISRQYLVTFRQKVKALLIETRKKRSLFGQAGTTRRPPGYNQTFPHYQCRHDSHSVLDMISSRGDICHCRHCRRQCKIFASGVNFSRNQHILYLHERHQLAKRQVMDIFVGQWHQLVVHHKRELDDGAEGGGDGQVKAGS